MDSRSSNPISSETTEIDEWDAEGFVIPSLGLENTITLPEAGQPKLDEGKTPSSAQKASKEKEMKQSKEKREKLYLGPHGVPPVKYRKQIYAFATKNETDISYRGRFMNKKKGQAASR